MWVPHRIFFFLLAFLAMFAVSFNWAILPVLQIQSSQKNGTKLGAQKIGGLGQLSGGSEKMAGKKEEGEEAEPDELIVASNEEDPNPLIEAGNLNGSKSKAQKQFQELYPQPFNLTRENQRLEYLERKEAVEKDLLKDDEEDKMWRQTSEGHIDDLDALGMVEEGGEPDEGDNPEKDAAKSGSVDEVATAQGRPSTANASPVKGRYGPIRHFVVGFVIETAFQRRSRLCSGALSSYVPLLRNSKVPFLLYDLGCSYKGGGDQAERMGDEAAMGERSQQPVALWKEVWDKSTDCHLGIKESIESQPNCQMVIGFSDHLFLAPESTLIARLDGPESEGHRAVVRLICGEHANKFLAITMEKMKESPPTEEEERFLKTVFVLEFSWHPGCAIVFFDSRTLGPSINEMGRLLLSGSRLRFGTKDGHNKWTASKFVCDQRRREAFTAELSRMRLRNKDVPKELGEREVEVRKVLRQKIDEEMFPVYQVTAAPPNGFFRRLWDGMVG